MTQVIDVAEQFVFERRIDDDRNRTVLVERARVALQTRREVGNVRYDFLNHHPPANANNTVKVKSRSSRLRQPPLAIDSETMPFHRTPFIASSSNVFLSLPVVSFLSVLTLLI